MLSDLLKVPLVVAEEGAGASWKEQSVTETQIQGLPCLPFPSSVTLDRFLKTVWVGFLISLSSVAGLQIGVNGQMHVEMSTSWKMCVSFIIYLWGGDGRWHGVVDHYISSQTESVLTNTAAWSWVCYLNSLGLCLLFCGTYIIIWRCGAVSMD